MSVVGARPQFVKLAPIAAQCQARGVEHIIVHTGQHYDPMLSDVFFQDLGIPDPDEHLGVGSASHGKQTGAMLAAMDDLLDKHQPDWVLVYGDTNSTLAGALAAVKKHYPAAHLEAGLRSFNRLMPEEINRIMTDHACDLLLTPTQVGAQHLATEGLADRTVIVGDVMTDVLYLVRDQVAGQPCPLLGELSLEPGIFALATLHRAENTDDPARLAAVLQSLGQVPYPVVLLAHPRLVAKAQQHGLTLGQGNILVHESLPYPQLINAARHARMIITDSGGLQKEAFLLRVPATTVRPQTEWVETVQLGWNVLVEPGEQLVRGATRPAPAPTTAAPYGTGQAAQATLAALEKHRA